MPLCKILGAAKSHGRYLVLAEIILDGEPFERCERPHDEVDLVALNQFNGFCLRSRRHARGVGDDKFDGSARKREVLVFQKAANPLLKVNASGCEPAGFHGHQSDLDRFLLRNNRFCYLPDCGSGAGCPQKFTPAFLSCHLILRWSAFATGCAGHHPPFIIRMPARSPGPAAPAVKPRLRPERQFWILPNSPLAPWWILDLPRSRSRAPSKPTYPPAPDDARY